MLEHCVMLPVETAPQFCVVALVLTEQFSMSTTAQYRPRPACMTCQVEDISSRLLKGVPNLASYGLQTSAKAPKAGSYKGPLKLRDYVEDSSKCIQRNISTRSPILDLFVKQYINLSIGWDNQGSIVILTGRRSV